MFKIGSFSKLSRVSVKTLRYYDQRGLLKPSATDESSGYRYYSAEQLLTVQRILAFKKQGFTLEEIKLLLTEEASSERIKDALSVKQQELQRTVREASRQLNAVHSKLTQVRERSITTSNTPMIIRDVQSQLVASIRDIISRQQLCLLLDEIKQYVHMHDDHHKNTFIIQWHNCDHDDDAVDVEVALPICKKIPDSGRVSINALPEIKKAVSFVYDCNPYDSESMCSVLTELASWISSNGYEPCEREPVREIYLTADEDMYGSLRKAELLVPLKSD